MRRRSRMVGGDRLADLQATLEEINTSIRSLDVRGTGSLTSKDMEQLRALEEQKRGLESQIKTLSESLPSSAASSSSSSSTSSPLTVSGPPPPPPAPSAKPASSLSSSRGSLLTVAGKSASRVDPSASSSSSVVSSSSTSTLPSGSLKERAKLLGALKLGLPPLVPPIVVDETGTGTKSNSTTPKGSSVNLGSKSGASSKVKSIVEQKREKMSQFRKTSRNIDILKGSVSDYYRALDEIMKASIDGTSVYRNKEHSTAAAVLTVGISRIGVKSTYDPDKKYSSDTQNSTLLERKNVLFNGFYETKESFTAELNKITIPTISNSDEITALNIKFLQIDKEFYRVFSLIEELSYKVKMLLPIVDRSPGVADKNLSTTAKKTLNDADNLVDSVINLKPTTSVPVPLPPASSESISPSSSSSTPASSPSDSMRFVCKREPLKGGRRRPRKTKKSKKSKKSTRRRR